MATKMILAAAALVASTLAAEAEVLFRGVLIVTSTTGACNGDVSVGDLDNAQFHPRGLGNSNFTALTRIFRFGGLSYSLNNANFGTNYRKTISGGLGWATYTANAGDEASVLLTTVPTITTATKALTLNGKIKNPNINPEGRTCEIGFRAVMVKDE